MFRSGSVVVRGSVVLALLACAAAQVTRTAKESRMTVVGELGYPLSVRLLAYGDPQPSIACHRGTRSGTVPYDSKAHETRDKALFIRSLDIDALGEYECQVYNGESKPASLTVEVWAYERGGGRASPYLRPPPNSTLPTTQPTTESSNVPISPESQQVPLVDPTTQLVVSSAEGGVATLRCRFHGNPPPQITWRREQITIDVSAGRYRLTSDGALEIVSLHRDDEGVYICIAENKLGTAKQEIRLQVTGPVTSAAGIAGDSRVSVAGELGHPLKIRCLAYGYPQPSSRWYHGRNIVPYYSMEYEVRDHELLIKFLDIDTLGEYVCQVYNGVTKPASLTVEVWAYERGGERASPYLRPRGGVVTITPRAPPPVEKVPDVPIFTVPVRTYIRPKLTTVPAGQNLTLPCEVEGYPEPDVSWTKDGVPLLSGDRTQTTSTQLTVSRVTVNDSGVYSCHASNEYSQDSSTVQITVQEIYIPPQCKDNQVFANCAVIVRSRFCNNKYYSRFCCKSCVEAGLLDPQALTLRA